MESHKSKVRGRAPTKEKQISKRKLNEFICTEASSSNKKSKLLERKPVKLESDSDSDSDESSINIKKQCSQSEDDALKKLNNTGINAELSPIIPLRDLKDDFYIIKEFRLMNTRFGKKVIVELEEGIVFLPDRFNKFTAKDISNFNTSQYCMTYHGLQSLGDGRSFHNIEFSKFK